MLRTSAARRFAVHLCRSSGIPSAIAPTSPCSLSAQSYGSHQLRGERCTSAESVGKKMDFQGMTLVSNGGKEDVSWQIEPSGVRCTIRAFPFSSGEARGIAEAEQRPE